MAGGGPVRPLEHAGLARAAEAQDEAAFAILESSHANRPVRVADVESGAICAYQDALNERWGID